jgi:hypothetical protein
VRGVIHHVQEQVCDRAVDGVSRDPRPFGLLVGQQLASGQRFIVGDGSHADGAEGGARASLDRGEEFDVLHSSGTDHGSLQHGASSAPNQSHCDSGTDAKTASVPESPVRLSAVTSPGGVKPRRARRILAACGHRVVAAALGISQIAALSASS